MRTLGVIAVAIALTLTTTSSDAEVVVPNIKVPVPRVKVNVPTIKPKITTKITTPKTRIVTGKPKITTPKTIKTFADKKTTFTGAEFKTTKRGGPSTDTDAGLTKLESRLDPIDAAAFAALTAAIAKNPKVASPRVARALFFAHHNLFRKAIADLDAAIAVDSYDRNAFLHRAVLWSRFGDCKKALADYDSAQRNGMEPWLAAQGRAAVHIRMRDYRSAARDLEEATRAAEATNRPELIAPILLKRAELAREHLSAADQALELAQKAVTIQPNSAEAIIERGRVYEALGKRDEAMADYKKALDLAPPSPEPQAASLHAWALFRRELLRQQQDMPGERAHFVTLTPDMIDAPKVTTKEMADEVHFLDAELGTPKARMTPVAAEEGQKRIAFVIGNAHYGHVANLPNAERDIAYVAVALLGAGFESVRIGFDLDKSTFEQGLDDFGKGAAAADWAFVYYAGHGIEIGDKNYLVPTDSNMTALRNPDAETVPLETIVDHVKPAHSLRVVMLDACRDNPFVQEAHLAQSESRSIELNADELAAFHDIGGGASPPVAAKDVGTFIAFATEHGETALDGDGLDSPFATAFVRAISEPNLEIRPLFDKIRGEVLTATNDQQHPTVYFKLPEEKKFVFIEKQADK